MQCLLGGFFGLSEGSQIDLTAICGPAPALLHAQIAQNVNDEDGLNLLATARKQLAEAVTALKASPRGIRSRSGRRSRPVHASPPSEDRQHPRSRSVSPVRA